MLTPNIFILPGFMASELDGYKQGARFGQLWLNWSLQSLGYPYELELATDGTTQARPNTDEVRPTSPIPGYYDLLAYKLSPGYSVKIIPTDWRLRVTDIATRTLAKINAVVGSGNFSMIGHSQGGLVAWQIYKLLVAAGQTGRIKRIVTLGTPFHGSYGAVKYFGRIEHDYLLVAAAAKARAYLTSYLGSAAGSLLSKPVRNLPIPDAVDRLICSWPAIYELLPSRGSTTPAGCIPASDLFDTGILSRTMPRVRSDKLDEADAAITARLTGAMPNAALSVHVFAVGSFTSFGVRTGREISDASAFVGSQLGDNRVTQESAVVHTGAGICIVGPHDQIANHSYVIANMADWLENGVVVPVSLVHTGKKRVDREPTQLTQSPPIIPQNYSQAPPITLSVGRGPGNTSKPAFCP